MSRASTIRPGQPWQRAATVLTMVPLLLWSSLSSFGYFCRDGRYEPFCLAVDCCARAHTSPNLALYRKDREGDCRTSQWQANPEAGPLASVVARLATGTLSGFGFDHETACQPVLKQPGSTRVKTWNPDRDTETAGPLDREYHEELAVAAILSVETAPLSCGHLGDILTVLQRFTI